LIFA
jgi:oxalate decarboxylase family bicupin protein